MAVLGNDNFSNYPHVRFKPNQIMAKPPTIINNANDFKTNWIFILLILFNELGKYQIIYDRQLAIRKPIIMTKANIKGPLFILRN